MERTKSCTNFETAVNDSATASTMNLRKAMEMRQNQLQQHLHLHIKNGGGGDSSNEHSAHPAASAPLRKKMLQRQKHTIELDDSNVADTQSDLEEDDAAEEEYDAPEENFVHEVSATLLPYQKHLLYKTNKPHSDSSLLQSNNDDSACMSSGNHTTASLNSTNSPTTTTTSSSLDNHRLRHEESFDSATEMSPVSRRHRFGQLGRDSSVQSDSSRYSSVDSLLEARKPDPEAILINLGFGPVDSEDILSRIPARFLKPSQVRGIDTDAFVKRLQLANNLADHSVLGYRGLTGNPDVPPSSIVAKIMQRFEVNERKKSMGSVEHTIR